MHQARERTSLEIHRVVAERLLADPEAVLGLARGNLLRWMERHGDGPLLACYQEWLELLEKLSPPEVADLIVSEGEEPDRLRQISPFAGVLGPRELWSLKQSSGYEKPRA